MNSAKSFLLLVLCCMSVAVLGQIRHNGFPKSFEHALQVSEFMRAPRFDASEFIQSQQTNKKRGELIGKAIDVNYSIQTHGQWTNTAGGKVWQLGVMSENAAKLGLYFSSFALTAGCELYVYTPDKSFYLGAYTHQNNKKQGGLAIQPISGDALVIELWVPTHAEQPQLTLGALFHHFPKLEKKLSGGCHININCAEGADWQQEKKAVLRYEYKDGRSLYACTGALLNNTAKDGTPLVISANHCISTQEHASTGVFYFGYEAETCNELSGSLEKSISGANFLATAPNQRLDFSLFQLSVDPPVSFQPYYLGWNRATTPAQRLTTIHHPDGDVKKISFDQDPAVSSTHSPNGWTDDDYSHWVVQWDLGSTEGGSSGAPVFDQSHYFVGDLSGGDISCGNPDGHDYITKFHLSYDQFETQDQSLAHWLDPLGLDVSTLSGMSPFVESYDLSVDEIIYPKGLVERGTAIQPIISVINLGSETVENFTIEVYVGNILQYSWDNEESIESQALQLIQLDALPIDMKGELRVQLVTERDADLTNNTREQTLQYVDGHAIELRFPDIENYHSIGWELEDSYGEVIWQRSTNQNYMEETYPIQLVPGCYTLSLLNGVSEEDQLAVLFDSTAQRTLASGERDDLLDTNTPWEKTGYSFCVLDDYKQAFFLNKTLTSDGIIALEWTASTSPTTVRVFDSAGRLIQEETTTANFYSANLSGQQTGVYYICVLRDGEQYAEKLVKL